MADNSVSDFSSFINHQIRAQEEIETCLWKLEALIVAPVTSGDFYGLSKLILHNYFSVLSDLIEAASKANEESLSELLRQKNGAKN